MTDVHPSEGDTLALKGIVHKRAIIGTGLPCGYKLANQDQRFDEYIVEVTNVKTLERPSNDEIYGEILTLETEDGDTVDVRYDGREPIAGRKGQHIRAENNQGATQAYTWEKVE